MFDSYIKARYPVLMVVSPEEARVELELANTLKELKWKVVVWSHTDGFIDANGKTIDEVDDPVAALAKIRGAESTTTFGEKVVFLFRDLHPFFQVPKIARLIRDIAREFKTAKKTLIMISPLNELPVGLQRDVTLLEFGLPERAIIGTMIDRFVTENKTVVGDVAKDEVFAIVEACMGLTTVEAENAMAKGVVDWKKFTKEDPKSKVQISTLVMSEKANAIKKSGVLEWYPAKQGMDDIGGLVVLKEWLSIRKLAFTEDARKYGLPAPRGVMLTGIPGTGKSLAAKACAANFGVPLIKFDVGRVFGGLVGQSEANMRVAIQTAEAVGRCVLWVDEIEKAFAGMSSSGQTDSGVSARVFGSFITWMQEKTAPVFIVATCNKIDGLPPELLRKGRFDEIFYVDLPDEKEREEILKIHITKRGRDPKKFDAQGLKECASNSEGYSGAELEEAVISGLYTGFYRKEELNDMHILSAIMRTVPLSRSRRGDLESMKKWASDFAQNANHRKDEEQKSRKVDA